MLNHVNHLLRTYLALLLRVGLVELASLHDEVIDSELPCRPLHNLLLYGVLGHQPVDDYLSFLSDTMRPIDGLQVNLWIPIRIKDDHNVRLMQVDSNTTCARGQNEDLLL